MHRKIGWIKNLRRINSGGDAPPPDLPFLLTAAMTQYGVIGYERDEAGAITGEPFPGSTSLLMTMADDGSESLITMRFSGDATALLAGTQLEVDGFLYEPFDEPNYDAGDDVTDMAYNLPDSAAVFLVGVQYAIQFIRATP